MPSPTGFRNTKGNKDQMLQRIASIWNPQIYNNGLSFALGSRTSKTDSLLWMETGKDIRTVVNLINIVCTNFLYECCFGSFSQVKCS